MSPTSPRIRLLLEWCKINAITIDEKLEVVELPNEGDEDASSSATSIGVIAKEYIPPLTSLVKIPKPSVLSTRTSSCATSIQALRDASDDDEEPNTWLSLVLLIEMLLGKESRWHGYIQSLPSTTIPIAPFWSTDGGEDGTRALSWSKGTMIDRVLLRDNVESTLCAFWTLKARPFLAQTLPSAFPTYAQLRHAYSLVSSRAFQLDAYHGIAMVPIADAFNHVEENHVHFESDYHVCPTCGSLDICPHSPPTSEPPPSSLVTDDHCEIVSNASIHEDDEVFNTYDSTISNAQLLCHYGFLLQGNSNDVVTWSAQEVGGHDVRLDGLDGILEQLQTLSEDTELVFEPDGYPRGGPLSFSVNAEGAVSTQLLGLILLQRLLSDESTNLSEDCSSLVKLVRLANDYAEGDLVEVFPDATYDTLLAACEDISQLCARRIVDIDPKEHADADWGDIFDATPRNHIRTRMAITHAMSERSILRTCMDSWTGLADSVLELRHTE